MPTGAKCDPLCAIWHNFPKLRHFNPIKLRPRIDLRHWWRHGAQKVEHCAKWHKLFFAIVPRCTVDSTFNVRRIRIARLRIRLFVYRSLLCHHVARNTVFQMIALIDSGKRRRLEQEICVTYITSIRSILSFILLPSNTPSSSAECASKTLHVSLWIPSH